MSFPKLSAKEYLILDILRSGSEHFGLEMVKASDGQLKRGTIYVTLSRMADKGYVTSRQEKEPTDPGMPRRLYSISGQGSRVLNANDAAKAAMSGGCGYA